MDENFFDNYLDRLYIEYDELCVRLHKLLEFIVSSKFMDLTSSAQDDLIYQADIMKEYAWILEKRLTNY